MSADDGEVVREAPNRRRAEEMALVLIALEVPYRVVHESGRWVVRVPWSRREDAVEALDAYEREQGERTRPVATRFTLLGVHVGVALAAFAVVTGPRHQGSVWFQRGSAEAAAVLGDEPWRAVTALTLHADGEHLLGNAVLGAVVLGALGGVWGWGLGGLLAVASGAAGNVLNALLRGSPHAAVGASTALFGAIGVLAGTGVLHRSRLPFGKPWVSIAGALGLLAMLGAGEGTDILAHLFGLVAGIGLGMVTAAAVARPPGAPVQLVAGLLAVGSVVGAWVLALGV